MAKEFVRTNQNEPWVKGETYRFRFDISRFNVLGLPIPEELVPAGIKEAAKRRQVQQAIDKIKTEPKLQVLGYDVTEREIIITAKAIDNPIPLIYIAGGIIAVFLIFGLKCVLTEASRLVESGSASIDLEKGKFNLPLIPLIVAGGIALFAFRG